MSTPQDPYHNDDDFGYEEDHLYDEPAAAQAADGKLVEHSVTARRPSNLTSGLIYIIPILLVAGLAFWQFGGMNLVNPPPAEAPAPVTDASTNAVPPADNNAATSTDAFGQAPTDAAKPLPQSDPFAQQPTQPVTLADGTTAPATTPADSFAPPATTTNTDPAAAFGTAPNNNNFTGSTPPATGDATTVPVTPAPSATTTTTSSTTTNTAPGSVPVAGSRDAELQQRVTMLEQQLSEAQQTAQQNRQTIEELNQKVAEPGSNTNTVTSNNATAPEKTVKKKTARKKTTASSKTSNVKASGRYTLRAVGNGTAWVSDHGSDDLQQVKVGDSLPGIGKVKSITLQKGAWVIEGAKGSIR